MGVAELQSPIPGPAASNNTSVPKRYKDSFMSVGVDASVMPSLDAFDQEFGREDVICDPLPPRTVFRLSTVVMLALAAGLVSVLALWGPSLLGAVQTQQPEQAATPAGEALDAAISRLSSEVAALKRENRELREAQQQAAETIVALQAGESEGRASFAAWYTNPAALTYGIPLSDAPGIRRSATARPKPREVAPPRRDDGGPISLEPPQ